MKYQAYSLHNYLEIPQIKDLPEIVKKEIEVVGNVLPFKTNNYVVNELIDWDNFQDDPMFILTFPQRGMLSDEDFQTMEETINSGAGSAEIKKVANKIRLRLNPHPAGQLEHNVPELNGNKLMGLQHKYDETILFFPSQGQTCHAYCTFCFRWPQFVGLGDYKFAMKQGEDMVSYLKKHPEVTDVLFTGGDPMFMKASLFRQYIDLLLNADLPNLVNIRIGTKSLAFWPYRFLTDNDALDMLRTFRRIVDSGKNLAFMAHFNHHSELHTSAVRGAVERIQRTGAIIRTQSPVLQHINDNSDVWRQMWADQVEMGMVPYYMFMARDTGARDYFAVSIVRAWEIFRGAYSHISGISRTVRGPSMSANPGKVSVLGVSEVKGEKVIMLRFIQGRKTDWVGRPFFASYNENALWLDELEPAFGDEKFFFEKELRIMQE
jgi:KamA family protein